MPGSAIGPRKQFASGGVIKDFLTFDVPVKFAADPHGDESQMAGDGGVMRGLDGRDGRFAGFDAVEKIPPVIVGKIQLNLCQAVSKIFAPFPIEI